MRGKKEGVQMAARNVDAFKSPLVFITSLLFIGVRVVFERFSCMACRVLIAVTWLSSVYIAKRAAKALVLDS